MLVFGRVAGAAEPGATVFPVPPIAISAGELGGDRDFLRLDVRGAKEYAAGHLPGAVRLDLGALVRRCPESDPAEAACLRAAFGALGIEGEEKIAVYGTDLEFPARAFLQLENAGCRSVRLLDGGWKAWLAAGLRVSRRERTLKPRSFGEAATRAVMIEPAEALARLAAPPQSDGDDPARLLQVLDLRDGGDWTTVGYAPPPTFRDGHVPASLPWDSRAGLPGDARLPDPRADRSAFERFGPVAGATVDPTAPIALLGEGLSGARQVIAYLRLRGMGLDVRVVRGGFAAWTAAGMPVVRIVEPAEIRALLGPATVAGNRPAPLPILDLRDLADYDVGHLPGAAPLPLGLLANGAPAIDAAVAARWPKTDRAREPLVMLGYDRACLRGRTAAIAAAAAGFRQILWLRDGMAAWRAAELPLSR